MTWTALKSSLIRNRHLDKYFADPLDKGVKAARRHVKRAPGYEPLLFENNLQQLASHLDRALAFRREVQELEVQAVKAASEYELFRKQTPLSLELDVIRVRRSEKELGAPAQDRAASAFGQDTALNRGFREGALGTAAQLRDGIASAKREEDLLRTLAENAATYQEAYWLRHTETGNAHNYAERAKRVSLLFGQDWLIAVSKARVVDAGYRAIYAEAPPILPALTDESDLDKLVVWSREVVELTQLNAGREFEMDLVLPLVQPRSLTGKPLVTETQFKDAVKATAGGTKALKLSFDLPAPLFAMGRAVRLRRIGLAYGMRPELVPASGIDQNDTKQAPYRYRAVIGTPEQPAAGATPARSRPPVRLSAVSLYGGAPDYSDGSECFNVNPVGRWTIEIDPVPVTKPVGVAFIGAPDDPETGWLDLKLFLRLRCRA